MAERAVVTGERLKPCTRLIKRAGIDENCPCAEIGEILGVAGISGSGQGELLGVLSGEDPRAPDGSVWLLGRDVSRTPARGRRALGLCTVPEERMGRGAVPALSLAANTLLTRREPIARGGFVRWGTARQLAERLIRRFGVRARGAEAVDISGNFIDCSGIKGATAAIKGHGAGGRASSNWVIRDNTIIGGRGLGISVAGGEGRLDQIRIANNTLTSGRSDAFAAISLRHVTRSDVCGNAVSNASRGLVIANCQDIKVDGNSVSDNRPEPMLEACIEIPGSAGGHVANNSFHGGTGSPVKPAALLS